MRFSNRIILGVMLVLSSANVFSADTSVAKGVATQSDADKIARMLKEIEQLKNVNQQVLRQIQRLEKELVSTLPQQKKAPVVSPSEPAPTKQANRVASSKRKDVKVKKTPEASRSVTDLEREVHTAFNQTFSLELGFEYAHFDQSQLVLNGFLALDAIFLGEISIDEIESDILKTSIVGRWGFSDRIQLSLDIPYIYRETTARTGGAELGSRLITETGVDDSNLGDISLGMSYHLIAETKDWPDVVLNLSVTAPTGKEPYGIDLIVDPDGDNTNLQIPDELPTGSGVWSLSTGLSFLTTTDPAILFANIAYTHYFEESFSDLGSTPGALDEPGDIKLGDSIQIGLGIAFAINERTSYSMSFTQRFFNEAEVTPKGGRTQKVIGSDTSVGTFDVGVTYALTDRLSLVTNLGLGLTNDSSDYKFGFRFPYRF
ncbi:MAG: hypothetical protein DRQ64_05905 [Gammaproteobacteria bacterium]|nr:MAG: hypothetical protein DRQ64_05905 [Gammaproteobacteria bacterium]